MLLLFTSKQTVGNYKFVTLVINVITENFNDLLRTLQTNQLLWGLRFKEQNAFTQLLHIIIGSFEIQS